MIARIFEVVNFLLLLGGLWWLYRYYHLDKFVDRYQDKVAQEVEAAQRLEAEAEWLQRQAQAERERARVLAELRRLLVEELIERTRQTILQELDAQRQRQLVESFLDRIRAEELQPRL